MNGLRCGAFPRSRKWLFYYWVTLSWQRGRQEKNGLNRVQQIHLESHPYNLIPHKKPRLQILSPRVQPKNYRKAIWHTEASNATRMSEEV